MSNANALVLNAVLLDQAPEEDGQHVLCLQLGNDDVRLPIDLLRVQPPVQGFRQLCFEQNILSTVCCCCWGLGGGCILFIAVLANIVGTLVLLNNNFKKIKSGTFILTYLKFGRNFFSSSYLTVFTNIPNTMKVYVIQKKLCSLLT